ncbi:hypothetical protein P4O66_010501 [Electrophorus voltai]|uniref:Calcium channel, voltage-dependent, gamma subunit 8a n=1 Tax=Electrophorus voltai TaxID=2609070 RepID=A0AAD8Z925_9TELE|nr:hypothetical protein P4O66_010501 [Electrophorus voltai]
MKPVNFASGGQEEVVRIGGADPSDSGTAKHPKPRGSAPSRRLRRISRGADRCTGQTHLPNLFVLCCSLISPHSSPSGELGDTAGPQAVQSGRRGHRAPHGTRSSRPDRPSEWLGPQSEGATLPVVNRSWPAALGMVCEKGIQILLTIVGAFASFGLMTVAIGTDYWLYSRAVICNSTANVTQDDPHNKDKKDPGALTHSGLWRICCLEGVKRGVCSQINHFPEDADFDHDGAEYVLRKRPTFMCHLSALQAHDGGGQGWRTHVGCDLDWTPPPRYVKPLTALILSLPHTNHPLSPRPPLGVVRASNIFPILSAILLLMGGVCIAASRFYKSKRNIILGAGILFVAAGLSNIIGVIVYISAALGDISPKKDEDKKWQYSYGWSFYFGGLSFILAEMVGVLAVNIYIEKNKELRCRSRTDIFKSTTHAMLRLPSYRFRRRSRSSSRSTDPSRSRDPSPVGGPPGAKAFGLPPSALLSQGPMSVSTLPNPHSRSHSALPGGDISLYALSRDPKLGALGGLGAPPLYGTVDRATLYQLHNCFTKEGGGGAGAAVVMSGTLPPLKAHNPGAGNSSGGGAVLGNSVAPPLQPPPFSSSTVERERGMSTLDRLGKAESNSNTLNRKTTPV